MIDMTTINVNFIIASYILQILGFFGILLAWAKAVHELKKGKRYYSTRLLMLIITTITLAAYVVPLVISICYFTEGCFQPVYRDIMRLFIGLILFLYGVFKFLLYYTKDNDVG